MKIQPYYDRTDLIHVTTDTVRENLLTGMGLVVVVLLMFLTNVRHALIVALNVPLASCLLSACFSCGGNRPTCSPSAQWTSASSSIPR